MGEIRTKPASRAYRTNFDRVFKKKNIVSSIDITDIIKRKSNEINPFGELGENMANDLHETYICCNNDPHFGG